MPNTADERAFWKKLGFKPKLMFDSNAPHRLVSSSCTALLGYALFGTKSTHLPVH
jgi:hypothetical protein